MGFAGDKQQTQKSSKERPRSGLEDFSNSNIAHCPFEGSKAPLKPQGPKGYAMDLLWMAPKDRVELIGWILYGSFLLLVFLIDQVWKGIMHICK